MFVLNTNQQPSFESKVGITIPLTFHQATIDGGENGVKVISLGDKEIHSLFSPILCEYSNEGGQASLQMYGKQNKTINNRILFNIPIKGKLKGIIIPVSRGTVNNSVKFKFFKIDRDGNMTYDKEQELIGFFKQNAPSGNAPTLLGVYTKTELTIDQDNEFFGMEISIKSSNYAGNFSVWSKFYKYDNYNNFCSPVLIVE